MRSICTLILPLLVAAALPVVADEQNSEVVRVGPEKVLRWYGHSGRTYFVQASDPNDHLRTWIWCPVIETGNDEDISHEVGGTAEKGFFRLWYSDQPTTDPDGSDFDGDGLSNIAEVATHQTNPLNLDTDGDGIPDRWELIHLLNPNLDDAGGQFQGGSNTNLAAFQAGVQADPNATIEDYDGDSILNDLDSTPLDKDEFVVIVDTEFIEAHWDQGGEHRTTSAWSESFSIDRLFLRYPEYGVYVPIAFALNSSGTNGTLEKSSVRIEATEPSAHTRKIKFLDLLDTDYPSLLSADPTIATRRVVEFTIHADSTSSETIQFDPGVDDLTQTTPNLDNAAYLARAEIIPNDDQPGKTGDEIPSAIGAEGEKHYVSPKKSTEIPDDFVILKAKGIEQALFEKVFEWECVPVANGSVDPNDSTKYRVNRDVSAKTMVKLKAKEGGQIADLMNVWVVWGDLVTLDDGVAGKGFYTQEVDPNAGPFARWWVVPNPANGRRFTFSITPSSLITDAERPALDGPKTKAVPGEANNFAIDGRKADEAENKWDMGRRFQVKVKNPGGILKGQLGDPNTLFVNQPESPGDPVVPLVTPVELPQNPVEGNDDPPPADPLWKDEDTNPYAVRNEAGQQAHLNHGIGEMASFDAPQQIALNSWGAADREYGMIFNYQEFARLQLWDGKREGGEFWFRISPHVNWHHALEAKYSADDGEWKNNGSSAGLGHK